MIVACSFFPNFDHIHEQFKRQSHLHFGRYYSAFDELIYLPVVGRAFTAVDPAQPLGERVVLKTEPENKIDREAVSVWQDNYRVGYLSRYDTHFFRKFAGAEKILFVNSTKNIYIVIPTIDFMAT